MNLKDLPWGKSPPELINAIIEIPRGTRTKYEYDFSLGVFRLDRVLYASMFYPTAYGFIPGTMAEDGDPLDVLVMISEPLDVGVMVEARPIGLLKMEDEKGKDDKILAASQGDPTYREVADLSNVASDELRVIEHFFRTYKTLERKQVKSHGWVGREVAYDTIRHARERYLKPPK
jgi:inorganic pyrophosphatase